MSSTLLLEAASISITSRARPSRIARHASHVSSGSPSRTLGQLIALATIRASDVLPVPRGPTNNKPWPRRFVRTAFRRVVTTASWPTISPNVWARQRRYRARCGPAGPAAWEAPPGSGSPGFNCPSTGFKMPCTLRRPERPRALHHKRLGPGRSAAPGEDRLVLLPSGPDTVHESPLRGTRPSTSLVTAAFENGDLGREFSPAGADCRYRAPLVPRLARLPNHSRATAPAGLSRSGRGPGGGGDAGGEGGIRTPDGLPRTAFPMRRHRPLGDLSGSRPVRGNLAERVGFEPTVLAHTAFRERHLQPLGHLSAGEDTKAAQARAASPSPASPADGSSRSAIANRCRAKSSSASAWRMPLTTWRRRRRPGCWAS